MPKAARLSTCVAWSSRPVPIWRRATRWGSTVFAVAVGIASMTPTGNTPLTGPDSTDPRVGEAPDDVLGHVAVRGHGAGMPASFPSVQLMTVHRDRATIKPGLVELVLPLSSLQITAARRNGAPWARRKAADAIWSIDVVGGGAALTLKGRWLLLAQLGTLGGWPEPS